MGKGTDKLYITHSEWASEDAFSASAGAGVSKSKDVNNLPFKRLPFNFCALSLQPFTHPVCTVDGTTFELTHILPWIKKHETNPVDGKPLKSSELIKLNFAKNKEGDEGGEYVDPVTYKAFTDNTHIVALKNSGNVFSYDTVQRLNISAKNWKDLVSDQEFTRKDIITLQDPEHLANRNMSSFKYLQDGTSTLTPEQEAERNDPNSNLNPSAVDKSAKVARAKKAIARARALRAAIGDPNRVPALLRRRVSLDGSITRGRPDSSLLSTGPRAMPKNAAQHSTGKAAAAFTSTGLTPHTTNERALLTDEDMLLKPRQIKNKGYARLMTTHGALNLELNTFYAPHAVWNFVRLAQRGYYAGTPFHRNIRNFMIQGGDPTGTGRGGQSVWGKPFADEWPFSPLDHGCRGVLSMANKGRDTNTSQFFITYRSAENLNRKHTVFGRALLPGGGDVGADEAAAESEATLRKLEAVLNDEWNRPEEDCRILEVAVFVDPFEEFTKMQKAQMERELVEKTGGRDEDNVTWTGKRLRGGGGRGDEESGGITKKPRTSELNLPKAAEILRRAEQNDAQMPPLEEWERAAIPESLGKKVRRMRRMSSSGYGNFDNF